MVWKTAGYVRLSREDGDKAESDSIGNQRALLTQYAAAHGELELVEIFQDDGYTGTNFDRPGFQQMERAILDGRVNCVVVKDLSRFGRDYLETGQYLERRFPEWGVRFIAINDGVDSQRGRYDLLLPVKNLFNTQYARDISDKVRSALETKRRMGKFVGAFPSYGYRKDPEDHNHLLVDPAAARVIRRIFDDYEEGKGQAGIARQLNVERLPPPSEYKRMLGERYRNGRQEGQTPCWTYATVHRILKNRMYAGDMEQGRSSRRTMHGKARRLEREQWSVVADTHEGIIPRDQWERVQALLKRRTREVDFTAKTPENLFSGFLYCGDCGRAMTRDGSGCYQCSSYRRHGAAVCSRHAVSGQALREWVLADLNRMLSAVPDWRALAGAWGPGISGEDGREALERGLERLYRLKKCAYEDCLQGILRQEDFQRYQTDYDRQAEELRAQLACGRDGPPEESWSETLLRRGGFWELDRKTLAETVQKICVFRGGQIEICYKFSIEELENAAQEHSPMRRQS